MTPHLPSDRTMVLVPTYMEAATICRLIDAVFAHVPTACVLVVDDQSPDGTAAVVRTRYAEGAAVTVVTREGPRDYGASMREGFQLFLESGLPRLVTLDADLSHDPAIAARMLTELPPDGVAVGSRYIQGVPASMWSVRRMAASVLGNRYVRLVTGIPVTDCTSGFRCYARTALARVDPDALRSDGYAVQVEVLHRLWRAGCPITEVPIVYRDRLHGESKLTARIVAESLRVPWRLRRTAASAGGAAASMTVSASRCPLE